VNKQSQGSLVHPCRLAGRARPDKRVSPAADAIFTTIGATLQRAERADCLMRVLLADDHATVLAGMEALLRGVPRLRIMGCARTTDQLHQQLATLRCDTLVTDYAMPGGTHADGLSMLRFLRQRHPALRIVVHTMQESPAVLVQIVRCGVLGIVSKADAAGHLAAALETARVGTPYFSPAIQRLLDAERTARDALSPRETEVIRLYLSGLRTEQIAQQLHRSKQTISTQKRSAMRKLGVDHDAALVRVWASRCGEAPE